LEVQRRIGERFYHHTVRMNASCGRLGKDGDARVLRYQVHGLLWRHDIVRVLGGDGRAPCGIHEGPIQTWMDPFREQNPLVPGQIVKDQAFLMSRRVGLRKRRVELRRSKGHSRDLGVLRWRGH